MSIPKRQLFLALSRKISDWLLPDMCVACFQVEDMSTMMQIRNGPDAFLR
jgi:hypothetical protein